MKYFIHTFGCQMNEYDSNRLSQYLEAAGWEAAAESEAELLLANTCTVRKLAEDKAFSLLGRWAKWKKTRPELIIGMVGCLAQHLQKKVFERMPAIDFMAGPRAINQIALLVEKARQRQHVDDFSVHAFDDGVRKIVPQRAQFSAYVAAMEGCDQFCSYCAVPRARGREVSRPLPAILEEIRQHTSHGIREIILLGQNITRYGLDLDGLTLSNLLQAASEIENVLRLRFLTSHPSSLDDAVIDSMVRNSKICRALHLPIQSGSNAILTAMRRGYTIEEYLRLVEKIRKAIPNISLTTDFIVGFPGETDADFQASLDVARIAGFDAAYCFKFSPRHGTVAAVLPGQIDLVTKEARLEILLKQLDSQAMAAKLPYVGHSVKVLVEAMDTRAQSGWLQGKTSSNFIVKFPGPESWIGQELPILITGSSHWFLFGELDREGAHP